MKTILELSHIKARQYFLESQNYCNMQFPKYIDFKPVIEYIQNSVGNKELRDILKDPKRMPYMMKYQRTVDVANPGNLFQVEIHVGITIHR